jgi:hypothetical protein
MPTTLHKLGGQWFHNENLNFFWINIVSYLYKKLFHLKLNFEMAFSCSTYHAFTQVLMNKWKIGASITSLNTWRKWMISSILQICLMHILILLLVISYQDISCNSIRLCWQVLFQNVHPCDEWGFILFDIFTL